MSRVYVTRDLPDPVMSEFAGFELVTPNGAPPDAAELRAQAAISDALVVTISERLDAGFFAALGRQHRLRVVSSMSTGIDHVDTDAAARAGVSVLRLPGSVTGPATAELAWALVLAAARGVFTAADDLRAGRWSTWIPWQWTGVQLDGATLGIVGFGAIGARVARYGAAFGMDVLCTTRTVPDAGTYPGVRFVDLPELARRADVISLHVPLTAATACLVDAGFLEGVRPGTVLVNTSRGGVLDEPAVLAALESGRLGAVGLDVYSREPVDPHDPLVRHPRVVALPHIGSATTRARVQMAVDSIRAAADALGH